MSVNQLWTLVVHYQLKKSRFFSLPKNLSVSLQSYVNICHRKCSIHFLSPLYYVNTQGLIKGLTSTVMQRKTVQPQFDNLNYFFFQNGLPKLFKFSIRAPKHGSGEDMAPFLFHAMPTEKTFFKKLLLFLFVGWR